MEHSHILIAGAGPAGGSAARTLRAEGFEGRITLVGGDHHPPYLRPALSKQYLRGEVDAESLLLDPRSWYADNGVALRIGSRMTHLDTGRRVATLDNREELPYDALLLATGSTPRLLPLVEARLAGVHTLRSLDDATALRSRLLGGGRRVVLIGSGWIGMEVAASALMLGNAVTVLERGPVPLSTALGTEVGSFLLDLHRSHGVVVRSSVQVDAITGTAGVVDGVRLRGGEVVPADVVIVAIGVVPNLALAQRAGLAVDGGVPVDAGMRTSDPGVWAAGDIAAVLHPVAGVRIRSEHFSNAERGGAVAARTLLGQDATYDAPPTFFSTQFDVTIQFAGYAPLMRGARVLLRNSPGSGAFTAFWTDEGGRLVAGVNVNTPDEHGPLKELLRRLAPIDPSVLVGPGAPLVGQR